MTELMNLALEGRMYFTLATWLGIIAVIGSIAFVVTFVEINDDCKWEGKPMSPRAVRGFWVLAVAVLLFTAGAIYCGAMSAGRPTVDEAKQLIEKTSIS